MPVSVNEYLPPVDFELAQIAADLPAPLHAGDAEVVTRQTTYYDTFDQRLHGSGMQLVFNAPSLTLLDADRRRIATVRQQRAPELIRPAELPAGSLRERLTTICDLRALLRVAELASSGETLAVLDHEGKTVARVALEDAVLGDGRTLRRRLYLHGVRGYDKPLARTRALLEGQLGLMPATETLADELRAGVVVASRTKLEPDLPGDRAAVAICIRLLHVIEANLPGTLEDLDSEFLHDLRVAVRRTRALQRELKRVFPREQLEHYRQEFRWLQQVTGPVRDLDVYLLDFPGFAAELPERQQGDLDGLRTLLSEHLAAERALMEKRLRSARAREALAGWADFLDQLPTLPVDDRPDAVVPIGELAAQRIDRVYRRMVRMGTAIDDNSPAEALHELRKKGKELRYLLEFFATLFSGKVTKPMVRTLKDLQDTLGRFQDREVQATMIRGLAPELSMRADGAASLMAIGVLVERLDEHQRDARAEFHERFSAFAAPDQRKLVKETFR